MARRLSAANEIGDYEFDDRIYSLFLALFDEHGDEILPE